MNNRVNVCSDEYGQMLLATGVVLLMSLLSMAVFGVKVAGLSLPHEPTSDAVLETTAEVNVVVPQLVEQRTTLWIEAGIDTEQAVALALASTQEDLLHHGEIRGVEIKLLDLSSTITNSTNVEISGELGISDGHAMMITGVDFSFTLS